MDRTQRLLVALCSQIYLFSAVRVLLFQSFEFQQVTDVVNCVKFDLQHMFINST